MPEILKYLNDEVIPEICAHGWTALTGETDDRYVTYTVGLTDAGLAELAVADLPQRAAEAILTEVVPKHLRGEVKPGEQVLFAEDSVAVRPIDAPGILGPGARALYGRRVRFVQLLWPAGGIYYPDGPHWPQGYPPQHVYTTPLPEDMLPDGDGIMGHYDVARMRYDTHTDGTDGDGGPLP